MIRKIPVSNYDSFRNKLISIHSLLLTASNSLSDSYPNKNSIGVSLFNNYFNGIATKFVKPAGHKRIAKVLT